MGEAARIHDEGARPNGRASMTAVPGTGDASYDRHGPAERPEPRTVEVRRNAVLAGVVGVVAAAVSIAYLGRATATGALLDWVLTLVTAAFAVTWLWSLLDARTPLLVADAHGVRVRLGRTWEGLPWRGLDRVEHHPRRGLGRDGRLVLVPEATTPLLDGLDRTGRRHARLSRRLHGSPFAVPLGLATRLSGVRADELADVLQGLAGADARVVELGETVVAEDEAIADEPADASVEERHVDPVDPADPADLADLADLADAGEVPAVDEAHDDHEVHDEHDDAHEESRQRPAGLRPVLARWIGSLAAKGDRDDRDDREERADADTARDERDAWDDEDRAVEVPEVEDEPASETPAPVRDARGAARGEVRRDAARRTDEVLPEARELRRPGSVDLVEDAEVWGARVRPIARAGDAVEPIVLDDFAVEPATDPVVGPELAAARVRLALTVDQLADRTRIRPHVIESIEVDDFAPCGGDFYARGHLRTLARVLGVDAGPLLATYDERYADAPVDPRRVFAAELATGANGSIRGTRGGPSWSVLVAAVMVVVLVWSVARLLIDDPVDLQPVPQFPQSNGVAVPPTEAVPMEIRAVQGGATVEVRDGANEVVWSGDLAMGDTREIEVAPPVRIEASDGGAIATTLDGQDNGRLGEVGQRASDTLVPR